MHSLTFSPRLFQDKIHSKQVVENVFPLLSLREVLTFSRVSKTCLFLWKNYYSCNKNHVTKSINRWALKLERLPFKQATIEAKDPEIRSACRTSIDKKSIFLYRPVFSDKRRCRFNQVVVEHYNVEDLKLIKVIEIALSGEADVIQKLVYLNKRIYLSCADAVSEPSKSFISIVDLKTKISGTKNGYHTREIQLLYLSKVFEVFGKEIIVCSDTGHLEFYDRREAKLLLKADTEGVSAKNKILSGTIENGLKILGNPTTSVLYLRLAQGQLQMYNLEARKLMATLKGPKCGVNEEHFEVIGGEYLYTQDSTHVVRRKFVKSGEGIEIRRTKKIQTCLNHISTFQMGHGFFYMETMNDTSQEAYDSETFACLKPKKAEDPLRLKLGKYKVTVVVNDGIILFIGNNDNPGNFQQAIFVRDLNKITKNYSVKPEEPVSEGEKIGTYRKRTPRSFVSSS